MKTKILLMMVLFLVMTSTQTQADLIWDDGHYVFDEGFEGEIDMLNTATAEISGGYIGILRCHDNSDVDVYEFSEISILKPMDSSTANLFGGEINIIFSLGNSNVYIYDGMLNILDTVDQSLATLYVADNYNLDPTGAYLTMDC